MDEYILIAIKSIDTSPKERVVSHFETGSVVSCFINLKKGFTAVDCEVVKIKVDRGVVYYKVRYKGEFSMNSLMTRVITSEERALYKFAKVGVNVSLTKDVKLIEVPFLWTDL